MDEPQNELPEWVLEHARRVAEAAPELTPAQQAEITLIFAPAVPDRKVISRG